MSKDMKLTAQKMRRLAITQHKFELEKHIKNIETEIKAASGAGKFQIQYDIETNDVSPDMIQLIKNEFRSMDFETRIYLGDPVIIISWMEY